jgi:hypothetical protein
MSRGLTFRSGFKRLRGLARPQYRLRDAFDAPLLP